ncbi:formate dehydrogenase subunit gamma [Profundibacterium mesophilum]|uniref:Formate dehydrogenase gamma subunit n=1 Tax=Profundibacterium mesophilum KAUST100406-0324 TaxID=1037889 RepID=A0A921TGE6_9RHOB|nr:formate dehydrogenase subunit gamma [Profundibacterium mesophilum]KAF0677369.1 formate dehydrogenase gamma subunit [Profundibacterium mesophilum KAUST100406-0324]
MTRLLLLVTLLAGLLAGPVAIAQTTQTTDDAVAAPVDRSSTGGAQTLEDILRRQRGEPVEDRRIDMGGNEDNRGPVGSIDGPLGTRGGTSDAEMWRDLRYNEADVRASNHGPAARVLVQDGGMSWLDFRRGPLLVWGGWLLVGTVVALALFLLLRGRIRIDGPTTGIRLPRFAFYERFAHWMLAGSFLVLGITGLITLFGRQFLIPVFGREAFAGAAAASKWVHNNISWAFMVALVLVFVLWVVHNIPTWTDVKWLAKGGGIFGGHAHARKFNAGQKMIFWAVIILGVSISASGLSLLFPFELPMFAKTFGLINETGLPGLVGAGPLPAELAPQEEMQLSQLWHGIVGFVFMAVILAHIYLGTVGMEGAFDAMGRGDVELQWAREHHDLWVEELEAKNKAPSGSSAGTAPAE